jgi:hypothetical protein
MLSKDVPLSIDSLHVLTGCRQRWWFRDGQIQGVRVAFEHHVYTAVSQAASCQRTAVTCQASCFDCLLAANHRDRALLLTVQLKGHGLLSEVNAFQVISALVGIRGGHAARGRNKVYFGDHSKPSAATASPGTQALAANRCTC